MFIYCRKNCTGKFGSGFGQFVPNNMEDRTTRIGFEFREIGREKEGFSGGFIEEMQTKEKSQCPREV